MQEDSSWDEQPPAGKKLVEWTANLAAGALIASEPNAIGLITANALEKLAHAAFGLDEKAWRERMHRRMMVLESTSVEMDTPVDDVIRRAETTQPRIDLLSRVLDAADSRTSLERKIQALAVALARGLTDDAKLDESTAIANALRVIEVPHVRALVALDPENFQRPWTPLPPPLSHRLLAKLVQFGILASTRSKFVRKFELGNYYHEYNRYLGLKNWREWKESEEAVGAEEGRKIAETILGTLASVSAVVQAQRQVGSGRFVEQVTMWRLAELGYALIHLLREVGDPIAAAE